MADEEKYRLHPAIKESPELWKDGGENEQKIYVDGSKKEKKIKIGAVMKKDREWMEWGMESMGRGI